MSGTITLKFWGVRGSHPVPGETTLRYGGNTACVEARLGENTLILDGGTGIIALGGELSARSKQWGLPLNLTLLLSHLHHDHIQGLPFFGPAYATSTHLHILGPSFQDVELEEALKRNMAPPAFPVSLTELACSKTITGLRGGESFALTHEGLSPRPENEPSIPAEITIRSLRSYGHPSGVLIYRIDWRGRSLVYATDTEGYVGTDRRLANFAAGADVLIHDAQYSDDHYRGLLPGLPATQGFGHSTVEMACELAEAAGVKQLVLFHHDPNYNDEAIAAMEAKAHFPQTISAFEGLEISLDVSQAVPVTAAAQSAAGRQPPQAASSDLAGMPEDVRSISNGSSTSTQAGVAFHDGRHTGAQVTGTLGRRIQFLRSRTAIFGHDRLPRRPT